MGTPRWDRLYLFFALNYLAQGLSGFVYEPISYLLKDGLGLSAGPASAFVFWTTIPFLLKPVFGLATDLVPIGRRRRRPHIVAVSLLAAASWLALAALPRPSYYPLLALLLLVNVGTVGADVVCDGVMVEQGKASGRTGVFQAVQIAILYVGLVASGLGGGWVTTHLPLRASFALAGALALLDGVSALWSRETEVASAAPRGVRGLRELLVSRRFWALAALIFLWSFAPFLGTAQFYYQSQALGLSPGFIGLLNALGGVAGALGAAAYGALVSRWGTARLVKASVWLGAPVSLGYLLFLGPASTAAATFVVGFFNVGLRLALMDLAAQSCPDWGEATAFAAYMAVFNLAASASNAVGGSGYDLLLARAFSPYQAAAILTIAGSACTAACWPLLRPALKP